MPILATPGGGWTSMGVILNARVNPAISNLNQAERSFSKLRQTVFHAKLAMNDFQDVFRNTALVIGAIATPLALATKYAAGFEQGMADVRSKTNATRGELAGLGRQAVETGARFGVSSTQVAEGMKYMAQAGATPDDIAKSIHGLTATAVAEGEEIGRVSEVMVRAMKGMGLGWSEMDRIGAVLALTSARTATSIMDMGVSLTYAMSVSQQFGVSLEETSATLGMLANAGYTGSKGGVAFTNMMNKLVSPTEKAQKYMKGLGVAIVETSGPRAGRLRRMHDIVGDFGKRLSMLTDVQEQNKIAFEVFGIRGSRALTALKTAGTGAMSDLLTELMRANEGIGAHVKMAQLRLDSLQGTWKKVASGFGSTIVGIFQPLLVAANQYLKPYAGAFKGAATAMAEIFEVKAKGGTVDMNALERKYGTSTMKLTRQFMNIGEKLVPTMERFVVTLENLVEWMYQHSDLLGVGIKGFLHWKTWIGPILSGLTNVMLSVASFKLAGGWKGVSSLAGLFGASLAGKAVTGPGGGAVLPATGGAVAAATAGTTAAIGGAVGRGTAGALAATGFGTAVGTFSVGAAKLAAGAGSLGRVLAAFLIPMMGATFGAEMVPEGMGTAGAIAGGIAAPLMIGFGRKIGERILSKSAAYTVPAGNVLMKQIGKMHMGSALGRVSGGTIAKLAIGKILTRAIPYVGWGLLLNDLLGIAGNAFGWSGLEGRTPLGLGLQKVKEAFTGKPESLGETIRKSGAETGLREIYPTGKPTVIDDLSYGPNDEELGRLLEGENVRGEGSSRQVIMLCIDGKKVGFAVAKQEQEAIERSGTTLTPYQLRSALERIARPMDRP